MGTTTTLVTVQEFLAVPEPEDKRVELIGGEIVEMRQGGRPHADPVLPGFSAPIAAIFEGI